MKQHWNRLSRNERGFTLTEMIVVIALITLVGTFAISNIMGRYNKAKVDATKVQLRNLGTVLDAFKLDCGFYPTSEMGLDALVKKPEGGRECKSYNPEGYLKSSKPPEDGFNNPFQYFSDTGSSYELKSLGADAKDGGEGLDADISSKDLN